MNARGGGRRLLAWWLAAALAGVMALTTFQHYRGAFEAWLGADPARVGERARWVLIGLAALSDLPLVFILPMLWRRGGTFRVFTMVLLVLAVILNLLIWRLAALMP